MPAPPLPRRAESPARWAPRLSPGQPGSKEDGPPVGPPAEQWVERVRAELDAADEVRVLTRTTAFGSYDNNHLVAVERRAEHLDGIARDGMSRQRIWHVTAAQVVLAGLAIVAVVVLLVLQ